MMCKEIKLKPLESIIRKHLSQEQPPYIIRTGIPFIYEGRRYEWVHYLAVEDDNLTYRTGLMESEIE